MEAVTGVGADQGLSPYQFIPAFACLLTTFQERDRVKSYDGYQVIRVNISTERDFESIKDIYLSEQYDFWSTPNRVGPTDIMTAPGQEDTLTSHLNLLGIQHEIIYQNLENNVKYEKYNSITREGSMNWQSYQSLETIHDWMDSMATQYPALVTVSTFGNSTEGRPMKVMKISTAGPSSERPAVWLDGGIHAREWISPATVSYIANELILQATRRRVHRLVDSLDWYIVPVMNPDGYKYTMTGDRFWRKTRSNSPKRQIFGGLFGCCKGTDPNRNWDHEWGGKGTSKMPCSQIYHGPSPASEPEVKSAQDYILERKDQIKLFLTFHSYSQLLLLPWGYDKIRTEDYADLMAVGEKAMKALESVSGTKYTAGATAELLYAAAGGSFDWAKAKAGIKYAYAFELRDTGRFGFLLPPQQIIPSGRETFAAVKSMAEDVMKIYRVNRFHEFDSNSTHQLFQSVEN